MGLKELDTVPWGYNTREAFRKYEIKERIIRSKRTAWQMERRSALPPYSQDDIDFYTTKLTKFRILGMDEFDKDNPYRYEIIHCKEVLASHSRLREMELANTRLHDNKNPTTLPTSDKKC